MRPRYSTRAIATWPNAISTAGFVLVIIGCFRLDSWLGLALLTTGRAMDLFDGWLARRTHVTSRLGAMLDASLDKLALLAIGIAILSYDMAPVWIVALILLQNLANVLAAYLAERKHPGRGLHPSPAGKAAMAVQSMSLAVFVVSNLLEPAAAADIAYALAVAGGLAGSLAFGLWATIGYFRRAI